MTAERTSLYIDRSDIRACRAVACRVCGVPVAGLTLLDRTGARPRVRTLEVERPPEDGGRWPTTLWGDYVIVRPHRYLCPGRRPIRAESPSPDASPAVVGWGRAC